MATTFDDAGTVNMPNLVICTDPVFKPSVVTHSFHSKYYSMEDLLDDENSTYATEEGSTLWEAFEALTYDFEKDFHLYHYYISSNDTLVAFTQLKHGQLIHQIKNYRQQIVIKT